MFTGIIEEIGSVKRALHGPHSAVLTIGAKKILEDAKTGDSIAVNGICLTVAARLPEGFSADVMHETLNHSSLTGLVPGRHVNLERAMQANGRFGGHIIAGHVDGVGKIVRTWRDDTAVCYTIQAKPEIMRYIVKKGSVAVDGVSLTVASATQADFTVSVIPHTVRHTVLQERSGGDLVNLETDMIGKYVEKLLRESSEQQKHREERKKNGVTNEFLSQYGF